MLLRSSSTPVLSSLLSSHPESPGPGHGHGHHEATEKHLRPSAFGHHIHKLSFNATAFSCSSSPLSPSVVDSTRKGFRRAQSEGNLEELVASDKNEDDQLCKHYQARKYQPRSSMMLKTISSFSVHGLRAGYEDEEEERETDDGEDDDRDKFDYSSVGKPRMALQDGLLDAGDEVGWLDFNGSQMFIAKGPGIGIEQDGCSGYGGNGSSGGGSCQVDYGGDGRENSGVEEYYKKMVHENPNNPLFLRNYAQFLHQAKGETKRADEYYSRAILADPRDGELLSQYAKLVWEIHRDREQALSYFERAAQASPEDSHVQAAYAGFLWETEEDDDDGEDNVMEESRHVVPRLGSHRGGLLATTSS